jgi:hypothetical protein
LKKEKYEVLEQLRAAQDNVAAQESEKVELQVKLRRKNPSYREKRSSCS